MQGKPSTKASLFSKLFWIEDLECYIRLPALKETIKGAFGRKLLGPHCWVGPCNIVLHVLWGITQIRIELHLGSGSQVCLLSLAEDARRQLRCIWEKLQEAEVHLSRKPVTQLKRFVSPYIMHLTYNCTKWAPAAKPRPTSIAWSPFQRIDKRTVSNTIASQYKVLPVQHPAYTSPRPVMCACRCCRRPYKASAIPLFAIIVAAASLALPLAGKYAPDCGVLHIEQARAQSFGHPFSMIFCSRTQS